MAPDGIVLWTSLCSLSLLFSCWSVSDASPVISSECDLIAGYHRRGSESVFRVGVCGCHGDAAPAVAAALVVAASEEFCRRGGPFFSRLSWEEAAVSIGSLPCALSAPIDFDPSGYPVQDPLFVCPDPPRWNTSLTLFPLRSLSWWFFFFFFFFFYWNLGFLGLAGCRTLFSVDFDGNIYIFIFNIIINIY